MKKVLVGFVGAAALTTASMAMAGGMTSMAASDQSSNNGNAAGVIISGNLGYSKINYNTAGTGISSNALRGFAWNANLGYQFNSYVALESGYTGFNDINTPNGKVDTYGVDLLAKGILPINSQFNVFAKAGAMDVFTKALNSAGTTLARRARVTPEFGIGTSYNVTHNLALTLQGITTLAMKGPHAGTFTMPATYAGYVGASYKFNV